MGNTTDKLDDPQHHHPLLRHLAEWTRQVGEQPPSRVAPGIAQAARKFHAELAALPTNTTLQSANGARKDCCGAAIYKDPGGVEYPCGDCPHNALPSSTARSDPEWITCPATGKQCNDFCDPGKGDRCAESGQSFGSAIEHSEDWKERALAAEAKLNAPELHAFRDAVVLEAAHQRERWGSEHDAGKTAEDWLWLVAYLSTKASQANRYGDREKYLHHIITCAAACANWHAWVTGDHTGMRPGVDPERYAEVVGTDRQGDENG